uniref:Proliferating cell nuclear antigen PCNA N-terminal domain-containing protein n=1 Tax=viral metagenome TaxID=1070528 RepID=A0A6C0IDZ1_9ZZZZ
MKVVITDKHKKDLFVALFQTLKNCSTLVRVNFLIDKLYIQGMDKSHICLFDVSILKKWFDEYSVDEVNSVCFDTNIFHLIISTKSEGLDIIIHSETDDSLNVNLVSLEHSKGDFNKYFKIPLADYEQEEMVIPTVDYDAEFSISAKKICEIVSQMMTFGTDINVKCSEEKIDLITNGIAGEMIVNIPIEDLTEYSIIEGEEVNLSYSLNYINKMCLTNKLSNEIQFFISQQYPMKITYDLGDDSFIVFYIAPKIVD